MNDLTWKEAWNSGPGPKSTKEYLILILKGLFMGIADLIPGVSGGTIAFITGIYEDLLASVAGVNKQLLVSILKFDFKAVCNQVNLRFILPLGFGIFAAIISLARVMHYVMNHHPIPTWALFFGLILSSIYLIFKQLDDATSFRSISFIAVGTVFAYFMVSLMPVTTPDNLWFIFLCGVIGITAMILPGLSGSFLLLILGKYEYITGALKNPFAEGNLTILIVFLCGTTAGILSFSKVLNYFLKNFKNETMAFLTGILIGSLKKIWPWKEVLETKIVRGKVKILREANIMPTELNSEVFLAIALCIFGLILILVMDKVASKK